LAFFKILSHTPADRVASAAHQAIKKQGQSLRTYEGQLGIDESPMLKEKKKETKKLVKSRP
jgi:hypothetical protein